MAGFRDYSDFRVAVSCPNGGSPRIDAGERGLQTTRKWLLLIKKGLSALVSTARDAPTLEML
jgi:hypothetical protein